MLCLIQKNNQGSWNIVPQSGVFEGVVVATAEGVNLKGVKSVAQTLVGTVNAVWGLTILSDAVYEDVETLRTLRIGKSFDMSPQEKLWFDYDGLHDSVNHVVRSGAAVVAFGSSVFGKGVL